MSKGSSYKFNQIFGYKGPNQKINEQDIITALKFDSSGQYLALGDKAGRIIIFQTDKSKKSKHPNFDYYAQFQSHTSEFDCLNSQQVQESITDICWMNKQYKYHNILTTNSKSIKLWKMFQKSQKKVVKSAGNDLSTMPTLDVIDNSLMANLKHSFPLKHHTDIHTISKSFNQQYLLSFDDVQGFMWNLQRPDKPYLAIDYLKSSQPQDVKQNITCGGFHPTSDSIFTYGTNKKTLKLHDMRISAKENQKTTKFKNQSKIPKNFFTQFLETYSSIEFLKNGKYLAARDFFSVKVWDLANTQKPILDVALNDGLKSKLSDMFQKDCFFDKFNLASSSDGNTLLTGSYNNYFHMVDVDSSSNTQYELNYKKTTINKQIVPQKPQALSKMNYLTKTTACDFDKNKNSIAVSSLNCFYIYSMDAQKGSK